MEGMPACVVDKDSGRATCSRCGAKLGGPCLPVIDENTPADVKEAFDIVRQAQGEH